MQKAREKQQQGVTREQHEKNWRYWNEFSVHKWYPPLKDYTFETIFIDLSAEDCDDFVAYQNVLLTEFDLKSLTHTKPFPPYNSERLERIERELSNAVEYYLKKGRKGAFVKLSDRSPKDATTERGRILDYLEEPLSKYKDGSGGRDINSNAVGLPAIYEAMMHALKVTSGKEALQLLLTSFRTMDDLQRRLEYHRNNWEMRIAVREWVDFPLALEFRGLICDGKFNALSQYYYDCYFPVVVKHREVIERSIRNFWERIASKVPYQSYVMDFAVMQADDATAAIGDLPVMIIELNPFDEYTDGALFKWNLHSKVITQGPWSFQIVNQEEINTQKKTWWKKIFADYATMKEQQVKP